jgi:hypothetical protein
MWVKSTDTKEPASFKKDFTFQIKMLPCMMKDTGFSECSLLQEVVTVTGRVAKGKY